MPSVGVEIPEGIIKDAVAVAIADAFSPEKSARIIRDVVRAHLEYKERSYDRETLLAKVVGDMIRKIAMEEVGAQLDGEMGERVRKVVREALGPQYQEGVLTALRSALSNLAVGTLRVTFNAPLDD